MNRLSKFYNTYASYTSGLDKLPPSAARLIIKSKRETIKSTLSMNTVTDPTERSAMRLANNVLFVKSICLYIKEIVSNH